jgi:hypothetical protein
MRRKYKNKFNSRSGYLPPVNLTVQCIHATVNSGQKISTTNTFMPFFSKSK